MPREDQEVNGLYSKYQSSFRQPLKLSDVIETALGEDSDYIGVFIPGGHGALMGLPDSQEVKAVLQWAMKQNKLLSRSVTGLQPSLP